MSDLFELMSRMLVIKDIKLKWNTMFSLEKKMNFVFIGKGAWTSRSDNFKIHVRSWVGLGHDIAKIETKSRAVFASKT